MSDIEALKSEALTLAGKATGFASHLRTNGNDSRPDPADYTELAEMIRRLVKALPGTPAEDAKIDAGSYEADIADDGSIGVFQGDKFLFSLSAGFPTSQVKEACDVFNQGLRFAEQEERTRQQDEFKRAFEVRA